MAQNSQKYNVPDGIAKDIDFNNIPDKYLSDGQDIDFMSEQTNTLTDMRPLNSMAQGYVVPSAEEQPNIWQFNFLGDGQYVVTLIDANGIRYDVTVNIAGGTSQDLADQLESSFSGLYSIVLSLTVGVTIITMELSSPLAPFTLSYVFNGIQQRSSLIQEYNAPTELRVLQHVSYGPDIIVFSKGVTYNTYEIGYSTKRLTGNADVYEWVYTRLGRSSLFNFPETEVIDARVETFTDDKIAVYYTDNTNKPGVFYIPRTFGQDSMITVNGGDYTLNNIDQQFALQLVNNIGYIEFDSQLQSGGGLKAGGKRYAVRFGITDFSTTEWSWLSNMIPVFEFSTDNSPFLIRGSQSGDVTGKINILRVKNAKPNIFKYCEVAVVNYNNDQAQDAQLIGKFSFTESEFTVSHTGFEQATIIDVSSLIQVQDVILTAKNLEIKDNRENLANITIASDEDLTEIFGSVVQSIHVHEMNSVGDYVVDTAEGLVASVSKAEYVVQNTSGTLFLDTPILFDIIASNPLGLYNSSNGRFTFQSPPFNTVSFNIGCRFTFSFIAVTNVNSISLKGRIRKNGTTTVSSFNIYQDATNYTASASPYNIDINIPSFTVGPILGLINGDFLTVEVDSFSALSGTYTVTADAKLVNPTVSYIGDSSPQTNNGLSNIRYGEYEDPANVATKLGHTINEVYAFAARVHWKNGYISKGYPIGATGMFKFDMSLYPNSEQISLTTSGNVDNRKTFSFGLKIDGIDISSIRDQIDGISIHRADVINPTVLATGVVMPMSQQSDDKFYAGFSAAASIYSPYVGGLTDFRYYGIFLSPDYLFGQTEIGYVNGDYLLNFGQPSLSSNYKAIASDPSRIQYVSEYLGLKSGTQTPDVCDLSQTGVVPFGTSESTYVTSPGKNTIKYVGTNSQSAVTSGMKCISYATSDSVDINATSSDFGCYYAQYIRNVANPYDFNSIVYKPTGAFITITEDTPDIINDVIVFGGDTFTQKTLIKTLYGSQNIPDDGNAVQGAIAIYSQNRINTQMRNTGDDTEKLYPYNSNVEQWLTPSTEEPILYDDGYTPRNTTNTIDKYDPNLATTGVFDSRIYYSESKQLNSPYDAYRRILPLNYRDLDSKDGPIVGLYDTNNFMTAIQRNAVWSLPYNADVVVGANAGEVFVGSGTVYGRRGDKISTIGTELKTATLAGKNAAGNTIIYWYSTNDRKFMKWGANGIQPLSDQNYFRTWFLNNTAFIKDEFDIVLGFCVKKQNVHITSRAQAQTGAWTSDTLYQPGDYVSYNVTGSHVTYEELADIYLCVQPTTDPPYGSLAWQYIDRPNPSFYNEWTLLYNEAKNSFTTFTSYLPDRYFPYLDTLLIPNPISPYGITFELDAGSDFLQWYATSENEGKTGEFIVEFVLNKGGAISKAPIAIAIDVGEDYAPIEYPRLQSFTKTQNSANTPDTFYLDRSYLKTSIRSDENDNPLIGTYTRLRLRTQEFIQITNIYVIFNAKFRLPMK